VASRRAVRAGRNEQIVRILNIIRDLSNDSVDLYTLAETYGATDRTIRRDLDAIRQAGIDLEHDEGEGNRRRWSLNRDQSSLPDLDSAHYLALVMALNEANLLRQQAQFIAHAHDLSAKLERNIGPRHRAYLRAVEAAFFSWDKFAWSRAPKNFVLQLILCIRDRLKCVVEYRAPTAGNKVKTYEVLPLKMLVHQGSMYLHAWQPKHKTVLALNLSRLEKLEPTSEKLEPPPSYDANKLAESAFGIFIGPKEVEYELDFDAAMRPYIEERVWHPSEQKTALPDGGMKIKFTCVPSYEVSNWVASWRNHVKVIKPAELQDELVEYAEWLSAQYPASKGKKKV
jgi:predicted DNA-binding transcriptional regulator YafY